MESVEYVAGLDVDTPDLKGSSWSATRSAGATAAPEATVNLGALVTFVGGLDEQERNDVLESVQLAQRAADARHSRFAETEQWYAVCADVLKHVGWVTQQVVQMKHDQSEGRASIDQTALSLLGSLASQNALGVLSSALDTMKGMADSNGAVQLFRYNSLAGSSGNVQIGVAERDQGGSVNLAMGAFKFAAEDKTKGILFALFGSKSVTFWASAQKITLDKKAYAQVRSAVADRLGSAKDYIASLPSL